MGAAAEAAVCDPLALLDSLRQAEPGQRQQYRDQLERRIASLAPSSTLEDGSLRKKIGNAQADACLLCYHEVFAYDRTGKVEGLARNVAEATLQLRELYDYTLRFDVARALVEVYAKRWPNARAPRIPIPLIGDLTGPVDAFRDKKGVDVQVVRQPGATVTIVVFCGLGHFFGTPLNILHHGCLAKHKTNIVYLRDLSGCLYLTGVRSLGSVEETCARLRELFSELNTRKLVFTGNSAGVFSSLHYASMLDADSVVLFGGPTSLDIGAAETEKQLYARATALRNEGKVDWPDIRKLYEKGPRPVFFYYAAHNRVDSLQAENVADLPNMNMFPVDTSFHFILDELARLGQLDAIFAAAAQAP